MHRSKFVAQSFAVLALVGGSAAMAADSGWYIGASAGISNTDIDTADIKSAVEGLGATGVAVSIDDSATAWKLFGGYQLNKYLGFEASYVDLGEITGDVTTNESGPIRVSVGMDGTSVSVVGYLPVGDAFSFFGKLGAFFWNVNATASVDGFGAVSDKSDGLDMAFGLGANWKVIENVGLRAEWERFQMNEDDVDLLSLGIAYTFYLIVAP